MSKELTALADALDGKVAELTTAIEQRVNAAPLGDSSAIHLAAHDGIKVGVYKEIASLIRSACGA